ncbi:Nitrous oxide-stimulated promoter [Caloranaerobacter azorensis DSM 13643]|uniref:Nitrous oxide-stimulated promoter n=1 Tax=Caloranaerobacter azorensis DSM 13643 TaxID=1121264 RepID=A0A1M5U967_9FIRM|nr:nitrous oxide-stimulated promoter family protein [Caloranaerobacter azorensis]SHH59507.1 Nitrous oxide-stimulated promoter [Caloranaerobacter azorensis DSM 13643]
MDKLENEKRLLEEMIKLYCKKKHGTEENLCPDCKELMEYAFYRLSKCPFGNNKKSCASCNIKCYDKEHKDRIKEVMKFSGWRIFFRHPIMTLRHF